MFYFCETYLEILLTFIIIMFHLETTPNTLKIITTNKYISTPITLLSFLIFLSASHKKDKSFTFIDFITTLRMPITKNKKIYINISKI